MTLDFYDLIEEPFGFLPDSRFLYLSSSHRIALAALLRGLQAGRGFVTLLALPDMGKTTLLFHTLNTLGDSVATVYLFQAPRTPVDLLRAVLTDLGVHETEEDAEGMCSQLKLVLLESQRRGKRVIVVIDEAQNLDTSILDLVCSLPDLATIGVKLIQFILCGQPLLADKLAAVRPIQPAELDASAHLAPFSAQDTARYVDHRLRTAGYSRQAPLFTPEAAALVAHYSQGTPRMINHLCFEALSTAYRYRRQQIAADTVHEAAASLDLAKTRRKTVVDHPLPAQASIIDPSRRGLQPVTGAKTVAFPELSAPKTSEEPLRPARPVLVPTPARTQALPEWFVLSPPRRAAIREYFIALQTSQAAAFQGNGPIAERSPAWHPLSGLAIATALLLTVSGAVFGMYRAQTIYPAGKQSMVESPLPNPSPVIAQRDQAAPILAMERRAAPAALQQNTSAVPHPIHDLKGMDLQTALRALATRKQRQQQNQTLESAPPLLQLSPNQRD